MYKDKNKQREANRERQRRYKERQKALLSEGVTDTMPYAELVGDEICVIPKQLAKLANDFVAASLKRGKDIKVFEDLPADVQATINGLSLVDGKIDKTIKANRTAIAVNYQHLFPDRFEPNHLTGITKMVTGKPGDEDYNGVCTPEWRAERGR